MIDHKKIKIAADVGFSVSGSPMLFQVDQISENGVEVQGTFLKPSDKGHYEKFEDSRWYPMSDFKRGFDYIVYNAGVKTVLPEHVHLNPWIGRTLH